MKYCQKCGKELLDEAVICTGCGCAVSGSNLKASNSNDTGSTGWGVLGFFVPLAGLILYLIWKDDRPKDAKKAGKGALIGFIASIVFGIIWGVLVSAVVGYSMIDTAYML